MKQKWVVLLLLMGILWPVKGQDVPKRGKLAPQYHFLYNGTPMVDPSPVGVGSIMLDGQLYEGVRLHLNAASQDLVVYPKDGGMPFRPPRAKVKWFTKENALYVNVRSIGYDLPEGFYEVLYDGSVAVIQQISKVLNNNTGNHNTIMDLGYEDPSYRPEIYKYFAWSRALYVLQDSVAVPIRKAKDLIGLDPSIGKAVWKEVKSRHESEKDQISALMRRLDAGASPSIFYPEVIQERFSFYAHHDTTGINTSCDTLILRPHPREEVVWKDVDSTLLLKESFVIANRRDAHHTALQGVNHLPIKVLLRIPTAFGEGGIIKALLSLPGVKTVGEASGGFNVRGGAADQNLVLFNGSTIYNQGHLLGVLSGINPDMIQEVTLYKGSIPVRYGGRMSAVLDIRGRDGNNERIKGSVGLGLLTSRISLDGPISSRTTFITGGRLSFSDYLLQMLQERSAYHGGSAGFYDINLGIKHQIDDSNTIRLSTYRSSDRFSFSRDTSFRYANLNCSLRWDREMQREDHLSISVGYDGYENLLRDTGQAYAAYNLRTTIRQAWLRSDLRIPRRGHVVGIGLETIGYAFMGGQLTPEGEASLVVDERLPKEYGLETASYVGDEFYLNRHWSSEFGLRLVAFWGGHVYLYPEIRLAGKYSPREHLSFKAGFETRSQNIHVISNTTAISPMDTWKLSDEKTRPTKGVQASLGAYWTLAPIGLDLSMESYYKLLQNHLDYRSGAVLVMNPSLSDDLVPTQGKSWGIELMASRPKGRVNGWIAYTWSRTKLRDPSVASVTAIDGGDWYPASYDKPHELKATVNYELTHRYCFSVVVEYSTGRPITVPIGYYTSAGGYRLAFSSRNSYRIPDYFRIDAAFHIAPGHFIKALTHTSITLGCYNVTGRRNAYSVYYTTEGGSQIHSNMVSVFPYPVPYVNLNILF